MPVWRPAFQGVRATSGVGSAPRSERRFPGWVGPCAARSAAVPVWRPAFQGVRATSGVGSAPRSERRFPGWVGPCAARRAARAGLATGVPRRTGHLRCWLRAEIGAAVSGLGWAVRGAERRGAGLATGVPRRTGHLRCWLRAEIGAAVSGLGWAVRGAERRACRSGDRRSKAYGLPPVLAPRRDRSGGFRVGLGRARRGAPRCRSGDRRSKAYGPPPVLAPRRDRSGGFRVGLGRARRGGPRVPVWRPAFQGVRATSGVGSAPRSERRFPGWVGSRSAWRDRNRPHGNRRAQRGGTASR